jgi:hypothetical protein
MGAIVFNELGAGHTRGKVPYDKENTLQSITASYRSFMVEWLRIARQELEAVFGQPLSVPAEQGAAVDRGHIVSFPEFKRQ